MDFFEFFTANGYIFEVLSASALFAFSLPRRRLFVLRLAAYLVVFFAVALTWDLLFKTSLISQIFKFVFLFALRVAGLLTCFKVSAWAALFCETGAYATAHFIYKAAQLLYRYTFNMPTVYNLMYFLSFALVYALSYIIFARQIKRDNSDYISNKQVILPGLALLLFVTVFQLISEQYFSVLPGWIFIILGLYGLVLCVLILVILFSMFKSRQLLEDNKIMEHVLHLKEEQLETSKENIELINIKCHDLKHQISKLGDRISPDELGRLNRIITVYDMSVKTGNDALDTLLVEKSLYCESNKIQLSVVADGTVLDFMSSSDIYSLFGNALDNAFEALEKVSNTSKRIVSVSLKKNMGLAALHFENYYTGELAIENGLPVTTKSDKNYHGFGMRSIRMIVDKYKGTMSFSVVSSKFNLDIVFPL